MTSLVFLTHLKLFGTIMCIPREFYILDPYIALKSEWLESSNNFGQDCNKLGMSWCSDDTMTNVEWLYFSNFRFPKYSWSIHSRSSKSPNVFLTQTSCLPLKQRGDSKATIFVLQCITSFSTKLKWVWQINLASIL